ncbi:MAG: hypothetical protein IKP00_16280 [Victivallales bacterium]|nr:hypothetical protein [Victivallales bacterium]
MRHVILRTGALGDFILTLPLLKVLSETAAVTLVCRRDYLALLPDLRHPVEWISPDECWSLYADKVESTLALRLQGKCFHIFGHLDAAFERRVLLAGADSVVFHEPRPTEPPSAARRMFLEAGLEPPLDLETTPVMPRRCPVGNSLWIHAGSGSPSKNLSPDFWAQRVRTVFPEKLPPVIVSFGECDLGRREGFRKAFEGIPYQEATDMSLEQLRLHLEQEATEYWGADTGVTHLAAALGISVTAFFTTTSPEIWRPCGMCRIERLRD